MIESRPVIRWSAYEHEHVERGADWYWALGIITVSVVVLSVLLHDVLFGFVAVLAAVAIVLHTRSEQPLITFEISDRGIRIDEALHRWDEIISFWVEEETSREPILLIDTKRWSAPNLVIPIQHVDPALVRAYLREHAKEAHMREHPSHKFLEFFGF